MMQTLLDAITSIFNSCISFVSTVGLAIINEPILLFFTVLPVAFVGIGIFKRLLRID